MLENGADGGELAVEGQWSAIAELEAEMTVEKRAWGSTASETSEAAVKPLLCCRFRSQIS